jgi:hypothetical protein
MIPFVKNLAIAVVTLLMFIWIAGWVIFAVYVLRF